MVRIPVYMILLACLAGAALSPSVRAAAPFDGDPPVTRFVPRLDVYPQNFALAQGPDGVLYVGNADGMLGFNGEQWRVAPLPNGDLVRSLAADERGRIYAGGYNQFGYFERGPTGRDIFHDLTPQFASLLDGESFADIWTIEIAPQGVFFRGVQHLFLYGPDSGETRVWRREARFGDMVQHEGDLIVQFRGEGLRRFANGEWEPLPGTESLQGLVHEYVSLPDGGLLILSANGGWHRYRDGKLEVFKVPAGFPPASDFTRGVLTRDGRIALATSDGALVVLEADGSHSRRFDFATGFISALLPTAGGLFMASNDAILHVGWPARWSVTGKEHGLTGAAYAVAPWGERWFVLTGAGAREWLGSPAPTGQRFRPRDWTAHAAWDLLALDSHRALLAESYALLLLDGERVRPLTHANFYPRILQRSRFDDDTVYIGTELGFAVVRKEGKDWRVVLEADNLGASRVNSIVQMTPRELWLGTDRGGLLHARLNDTLDAVESVQAFGPEQGIEYGKLLSVTVAELPGNLIVAATHRGTFHFDGTRFVADGLGGLDVLRGPDELLSLAVAPDGNVWAYSFSHVYSRRPGEAWEQHDIDSQRRGALQDVAFDANGAALFSMTSGILRHQDVEAPADAAFNVSLRSVQRVRADGSTEELPLHTPQPLEFGADDVNLQFRFALAEFTRVNAVQYSARLEGLETQWSNWSGNSGFTYYRMRPGEYRLLLRARDSSGRVSEIEPWRFRVVPHWYASSLAIGAWAVLAVLIAGYGLQWLLRRRTDRLALETLRLEAMVVDRTRELEDANRKLEAIAHLDGLTEIPNRRRLDAYLDHVWRQCLERERPLSVLVIDVDHFKRYNDRHGHIAGDRLLQKLARILARSLRRSEDLVARYGGEEFLVVLPGAELETARELAESIRETVEISSLGATVSIGLATATPNRRINITDLVSRADTALYAAKAANRNCVRASLTDGKVV